MSQNTRVGMALRMVAAAALIVGGLVHLDLYFDGYRSIPDIGRSFMLNAIVSGVVAAAVAVRSEWFVRLAGIAVAAGTIVAFILSRTGDGLFDFRERGLEPSPQAGLALFVEIVAIVALAATFIPAIGGADTSLDLRALAVAAVAAAVVLIGFGAMSARSDDSPAAEPSPTTSAAPPSTSQVETPSTAPPESSTPSDSSAPPGPSPSTEPATTTPPETTVPPAAAGAVSIVDFSFREEATTIAAGTTVVWTNNDSFDHSVVADDDSFVSDSLGNGATFEHTFDTPGEFAYICGIHPSMAGTITVTG